MKHYLFLCIGLSFGVQVLAQNRIELSGLSPKQRVKLAKKEQKQAKKDPEYLQLMEKGLALFQNHAYEEARKVYQTAHDRRPQNVYPLVMLQDIEVAENKLAMESASQQDVELTSDASMNRELKLDGPYSSKHEEPIPKKDTSPKKPDGNPTSGNVEIIVNTPDALEKSNIAKNADPELPKSPVISYPTYENDGIYLDTLSEGSAEVFLITVVEKGVSTTYRKVHHAWGATYYFINGQDLPKHEYEQKIEAIGIKP
jgi:hypothetical protein